MTPSEEEDELEIDIWTFRDARLLGTDPMQGIDLTGFEVEALDGKIGKLDEATNETGGSYLVVDTGPWIFGKKVLLPAGVIRRIDTENESVYVNRTKDEIKNAPDFDPDTYRDQSYRDRIESYYGVGGAGYRDEDVL
jgi:hypothetical protein